MMIQMGTYTLKSQYQVIFYKTLEDTLVEYDEADEYFQIGKLKEWE